MKAKSRQSGLTLIEMSVVIAAVATLTVLSLPAIRTFVDSFEAQSGTRAMISASLASARAIAAKEQRYAGVRFQQDLSGHQYMIFIVQDTTGTSKAFGFRAAKGLQPIKLPDSVGVMDFRIVTKRNTNMPPNSEHVRLDDPLLGGDNRINEDFELADTTTFSVLFAPSGKLVIHGVRVKNRDGKPEPDDSSMDEIFNTNFNVETTKIAMFYQDDYYGSGLDPDLGRGFGPESSRNSFVIYDKVKFAEIAPNRRWSDYLWRLVPEIIYINPYTGTMISPN